MQLRLIGGSHRLAFYAETPLAANTTYRVTIDATRGTESLHFEWTFTTGEASRW